MIRVFQFGLLPPTENADLVRRQMRAAHDYRNELVAIERARRQAIRAIHEASGEVKEAEEKLREATKSDRRQAALNLFRARREAEKTTRCRMAVSEEDTIYYAYSPLYEMERIALLDARIRRDARAMTEAYWGTYLTIEMAGDQVRKGDLYDTDHLKSADPRFVRWTGSAQIGVQIQGGLSTEKAMLGKDTRARLSLDYEKPYNNGKHVRGGVLSIRVGSVGRSPIWAVFPIRMHRAIPDQAIWKWVRISCRCEARREHWTAEITGDIPDENWRKRDAALEGAIAVELMWAPLDSGALRVATWLDTRGVRGELLLPQRLVEGVKKSSSIRSFRDVARSEMAPKLTRMLRESKDALPRWLVEAASTLHLWRSPERFHRLVQRWRSEKCDAARGAYDLLQTWEIRDTHLWEYESGNRRARLRARREIYRVTAAQLSRKYKYVLLPDRDLSREARWGEESEWRFLTAPQELRGALRQAFGADAVDVEWRGPHGVIDDGGPDDNLPEWLEMAIERWRGEQMSGGARDGGKDKKSDTIRGGAWAKRKARKRLTGVIQEAARKPDCNDVE